MIAYNPTSISMSLYSYIQLITWFIMSIMLVDSPVTSLFLVGLISLEVTILLSLSYTYFKQVITFVKHIQILIWDILSSPYV